MTPKLVITKSAASASPAKSGRPLALYLLELRAEVHRRSENHKPFGGSGAGRGPGVVGPLSVKKVRS